MDDFFWTKESILEGTSNPVLSDLSKSGFEFGNKWDTQNSL